MATTDQTKKPKKPSLTEQLAEANRMLGIANNSVKEQIDALHEKDRQYDLMLTKKDKEMRDILNAIAMPLYAQEEKQPPHMDPFHYHSPLRQPSVQQLAGDLAGMIARQLEKGNLRQSIIEEQDTQIEWFKSLIERAFGVKAKAPKVEPEEANPEKNNEPKKKQK